MSGRLPIFHLFSSFYVGFIIPCFQLALTELQTVLEVAIVEVVQVVPMKRVLAILKSTKHSSLSSKSEISFKRWSASVELREHVRIAGPALSKQQLKCLWKLLKWISSSFRSELK